MELPRLLSACPLADLMRIDVGLEGDWSGSVTTVWSRANGWQGLSRVVRGHEKFKPSLELYFIGGWIGLHCFNRVGKTNVLDEAFLQRVVLQVEKAITLSSDTVS